MRHILVVCTANQCRSPIAEGLIRDRLERAGIADAIMVTSAGTWAQADRPASPHAITAMGERGVDLTRHRSREVDVEMIGGADLVLAMTESHRQALATEFRDAADRIRLFSSLGGGGWDIADPVGGSLDDYRATADELARLVDSGWAVLVGRDAA
jgi:protein-tyrosine-phosphatase